MNRFFLKLKSYEIFKFRSKSENLGKIEEVEERNFPSSLSVILCSVLLSQTQC